MIAPDAKLADQELFQLIFQPGFSTAKEVTNLSGRGVGMDVVKRTIENCAAPSTCAASRARAPK